MIEVIDKYGNSSSNGNSVIIIDKYGNPKKPPLTNKVSKLLIGSLANPTLISAVASSTGGTLPAATYFYKIVAVDYEGLLTAPSSELSVTTTGSTSSIVLTWSFVIGSVSYRIYRSNVSNTYTSYFYNWNAPSGTSISSTNILSLTDTNISLTTGSIPTSNNSSFGIFNSSVLRTDNIRIISDGIGNASSIIFEKSTDSAEINVLEYFPDSTMYEFKMTDNPDTVVDIFHWYIADWQNPSTAWKPLKFNGFNTQFVAQNTNFWSSFILPSNTPYYTTNPDTVANSQIKADPSTSTTYNLLKDNGTGTGTLNVDVTNFTGTSHRIYWVTITSSTTFNWGTGNYGSTPIGTSVTITGAFQLLDNGVQIKLSTSGQIATDRWSFRAFPTPRMGIGTSTPSEKLEVNGNIKLGSISSGNYVYYVTNSENTLIKTTRSDLSYPGLFRSDGWGNFTANTSIGIGYSLGSGYDYGTIGYGNLYVSGKVGIGTTSPTEALTVIGGIRGTIITATSLFSTNGGEIRIGQSDVGFASNITQKWSSTGDSNGSRDLGFRRNTAGVLEIYDGVTADGAVANRRDLLVRNITTSQIFTAQPTPTALSATTTLTIAQILTNIINVTSTIAVTLTLPTGTLTDAGVIAGALPVSTGFDWTIINTGSSLGIITLAAGTAHTIVGNTMIAIGDSATFRTVKTATNTFITYRIT